MQLYSFSPPARLSLNLTLAGVSPSPVARRHPSCETSPFRRRALVMRGYPVTGIGRAVRIRGYPVAGRGKGQVTSMPNPFGVRGPKVGNCIVVGGVPVARVGIGREVTTVLRVSIKKVIAETGTR